MKKTTNKFQRAYMIAKANVKEIESRQKEIERKYISDHGIINSNGCTPEFIYNIDDEATFEKANEECSALIVSSGLEDELNAANAAMKSAEDRLIEYGLSIAPSGIRAALEKGAKENYTIRKKMLDLVFRLDVSTVR